MDDLVGKTIGYYTVERFTGKQNSNDYKIYECRDIFGNVTTFGKNSICGKKFGYTLRGESEKKIKFIRTVWEHLINRCLNSSDKAYKDYGGRGIIVCDEWLGLDGLHNFVKWAAPIWEKGLCIDRINNSLGYSPANCRFVTRTISNRNKRDVIVTEDMVRYIRNSKKLNTGTHTALFKGLAKELGISVPHVIEIAYYQQWKEI